MCDIKLITLILLGMDGWTHKQRFMHLYEYLLRPLVGRKLLNYERRPWISKETIILLQ